LLLSLANAINQFAGGWPLVPNLVAPHMASRGVAQPLVLDQLQGNAAPTIDYDWVAHLLTKVDLYPMT
jgi:hypothetical protein